MENPQLFLIESVITLFIVGLIAMRAALLADGSMVLFSAGLGLLILGELVIGGLSPDSDTPPGVLIFTATLIVFGALMIIATQPQNDQMLRTRETLCVLVGLALIFLTLRTEYLRMMDGKLTIFRIGIYTANIGLALYILISGLRLATNYERQR